MFDRLTAVAIHGCGARFVRDLPLALEMPQSPK